MTYLKNEDVKWVVNDFGELGVKINEQFFFMYKGRSIQSGDKWRYIGKREFGETCRAPGHIIFESYVGLCDESESLWNIIQKTNEA